jgi:ATP-dependent exoDNAse (exonuclease V) alpha subunit
MKEHDTVVLTRDIARHGLKEGDVGAIVSVHAEREVFEVEFVTFDGATVAVLTLDQADIQPVSGARILHARSI